MIFHVDMVQYSHSKTGRNSVFLMWPPANNLLWSVSSRWWWLVCRVCGRAVPGAGADSQQAGLCWCEGIPAAAAGDGWTHAAVLEGHWHRYHQLFTYWNASSNRTFYFIRSTAGSNITPVHPSIHKRFFRFEWNLACRCGTAGQWVSWETCLFQTFVIM